jgi:hypothetical protein
LCVANCVEDLLETRHILVELGRLFPSLTQHVAGVPGVECLRKRNLGLSQGIRDVLFRETPEGNDHFRMEGVEEFHQVRTASLDLVLGRLAVSLGSKVILGTTYHEVSEREVQIVASGLGNRLLEELTGSAYERSTEDVLGLPRTFSHKHHLDILERAVHFLVHDMLPCTCPEVASGAVLPLVVNDPETESGHTSLICFLA